jgi:spermidine/putrescine-binding protein
MSSRIPPEFVGTPTLNDEKLAILMDWLISAMGDGDHADMIDADYYAGLEDGLYGAVDLLYQKGKDVVVVAQKPVHHILTKKNIIIGVSAFVLYKNRKHIRAAYEYAHHAAYEFVTDVSAELEKKQKNNKTV